MYKLEWDSNFWSVDVYNVDDSYNFSTSMVETIKHSNWLVQALVPEQERDVINSLENYGFRFVETKVNLVKKVLEKREIEKDAFKKIQHHEIEIHKNDFYTLFGEISRFYFFKKEMINNFYYLWLINSIDGKMDDECIGYYINGKLAGFITYKDKNGEVSIGLLGVFPEFQKKGVSQQLLNWINNKTLENGNASISVSTQGKNYYALNSYIKNGFMLMNIQNWYYLRGEKYDKF
ncbi:GNAT family N-acetyltransferase [Mesobacillus jeotgali]|uniref:GNAT family N-acetyltransferase n=1 Tax=Mesobacillus jeotgali TaxID=129985 RepID=UPI001CFC90F5|nr:GNAT family N-acetyltransferase [Mesobacillus jeotgali]